MMMTSTAKQFATTTIVRPSGDSPSVTPPHADPIVVVDDHHHRPGDHHDQPPFDSSRRHNGYNDAPQPPNDSAITASSSSSSSSFTFYDHMDVFHGLRCFNSLCIVLFHINQGIFTNVLSQEQNYECLYGDIVVRFGTTIATIIRMILDILFLRITYHMTLFWILSGFLCEYQLHHMYLQKLSKQQLKQQDNNDDPAQQQKHDDHHHHRQKTSSFVSIKDGMTFFGNRLLRIYPLYTILPLWGYYNLHYRLIEHQKYYDYPLSELIRTLLYIREWAYHRAIMLATLTWSVQVDIHGYVAIIILFLLFPTCYYYTHHPKGEEIIPNDTNQKHGSSTITIQQQRTKERYHNTKYKRYVLMVWYVGSVIYMLSLQILPQQYLSEEDFNNLEQRGVCGIEFLNDGKAKMLGLYEARYEMYPHIDFDHNPSVEALNQYMHILVDRSYFRSIFNHGSSMLLGSLLYLQLYCVYGHRDKKGKAKNGTAMAGSSSSTVDASDRSFLSLLSWIDPNYMPLLQWTFAWFFLVVTSGFFSVSGVASFFMVKSILTMKFHRRSYNRSYENKDQSTIQRIRYQYIDPCIDYYYRMIVTVCCHPFMKWLSKYTYGIYIFHYGIMIKRGEYRSLQSKQAQIITEGAARNISACQALQEAGMPHNLFFILKEGIIVFTIASLCAMLFYHIVEIPIGNIRKYGLWHRHQKNKIE